MPRAPHLPLGWAVERWETDTPRLAGVCTLSSHPVSPIVSTRGKYRVFPAEFPGGLCTPSGREATHSKLVPKPRPHWTGPARSPALAGWDRPPRPRPQNAGSAPSAAGVSPKATPTACQVCLSRSHSHCALGPPTACQVCLSRGHAHGALGPPTPRPLGPPCAWPGLGRTGRGRGWAAALGPARAPRTSPSGAEPAG